MRKLDKLTTRIYIPIFTALILIILSVIVVYTKMDQKDKNTVDSFELGNKQVYQAVYGSDAEKTVKYAKNNAIKLDMKISSKSRNSQIRKINGEFGQTWIKCDKEVIDLIEKCIDMGKLSKSTFDITCGNLEDLWNLGIKNFRPSSEDIQGALLSVDYKFIKINRDVSRVRLDNKSSKVTLDSIEDGAVCSSIIETYSKMNVDYAITSVGNVTGVYGTKTDVPYWKLSVRDVTENKNDEVGIAFIKVINGYMCTLTNPLTSENRLFHKNNTVIDLRTGYLNDNGISSVAVLCDDAVTANGLAYICSVLDKEQSEELLDYYKAEGVFVYKDRSIYITDGLKERFVLVNKNYKLVN